MRFVAERMATPRSLYADFPLGWPIGQPKNAEFQHRVLAAAFDLLAHKQGPVLEDFPERIESKPGEPLSCSLPARYDPDLHPTVDEAQALRKAYDRAVKKNGRTSVGRTMGPDQIPDALAKFANIAAGESWDAQGIEAMPMMVAHDIRAYYEELAFELADAPVVAYGAERWFYDETEAGRTLMAARRRMQQAGLPELMWFYLAPASRS